MENVIVSVEDFQNYMIRDKLSSKTKYLYNTYFAKLDQQRLLIEGAPYIDELLRDKKHNNAVCRAFIRKLFKYIRRSSNMPKELIDLVNKYELEPTGAKVKKTKEILTIAQINTLANSFGRAQQYLMVLSSFYLGLRLEELLSLTFDDIDWTTCEVKIRWQIAKRHHERIIPAPRHLIEKISLFIQETIRLDETGYYKINRIIFPYNKHRWWRDLKKQAKDKMLAKDLSPHCLRHSCASYLFNIKKWNIVQVQEFLGHKDMSTTRIYIHQNKEELRELINNAFPDEDIYKHKQENINTKPIIENIQQSEPIIKNDIINKTPKPFKSKYF